jgi:hypothetical protein
MSRYTKGPWKIVFSPSGYPYEIVIDYKNEAKGVVRSVIRWGGIGFPSSQEGLANARLIAAAPDMADEIRKQIVLLKRVYGVLTMCAPGSDVNVVEQSIKAFQAVISKAEGGL